MLKRLFAMEQRDREEGLLRMTKPGTETPCLMLSKLVTSWEARLAGVIALKLVTSHRLVRPQVPAQVGATLRHLTNRTNLEGLSLERLLLGGVSALDGERLGLGRSNEASRRWRR